MKSKERIEYERIVNNLEDIEDQYERLYGEDCFVSHCRFCFSIFFDEDLLYEHELNCEFNPY